MLSTSSKLVRGFALALLTCGVASAVALVFTPFRGQAAGSVVSVVPTPDGVLMTIHATGTATQIGNFERVEELLLNPATGSFTGTIVYVGANHDELHTTMVGGFNSPTTAIGTYTIVGGTGRFASATGSADFEAVSPDGVQMTVAFQGVIAN